MGCVPGLISRRHIRHIQCRSRIDEACRRKKEEDRDREGAATGSACTLPTVIHFTSRNMSWVARRNAYWTVAAGHSRSAPGMS